MNLVINNEFGGFRIPNELVAKVSATNEYDDSTTIRLHPELMKWVKKHPYMSLKIVSIPDEATDWRIEEYDGLEKVIAVLDGKMVDILP